MSCCLNEPPIKVTWPLYFRLIWHTADEMRLPCSMMCNNLTTHSFPDVSRQYLFLSRDAVLLCIHMQRWHHPQDSTPHQNNLDCLDQRLQHSLHSSRALQSMDEQVLGIAETSSYLKSQVNPETPIRALTILHQLSIVFTPLHRSTWASRAPPFSLSCCPLHKGVSWEG